MHVHVSCQITETWCGAGTATCSCFLRVHPTCLLRCLLRARRVGLRVGLLRGLSAHLQQAGLRHGMLQRGEGVVLPTYLRGVGEGVRLRGKSGDGTPKAATRRQHFTAALPGCKASASKGAEGRRLPPGSRA